MHATRHPPPAPPARATVQRAALYLLLSGGLHAAVLLLWLANNRASFSDDVTRVRLLDPAEDAVSTRILALRAEAVRAEAALGQAERQAAAATVAAQRALERLEQVQREVEAASSAEAPKKSPTPLKAATDAAKREVQRAELARLAADRTADAAHRRIEDARIEVAKAEAMRAEATRAAASESPPPSEKLTARATPAPPPPIDTPLPPPREPLDKPAARAGAREPDPAGGEKPRGGGPVTEWLSFVRSEGEDMGSTDADARYISDRNRRAPEEIRAITDVDRANGEARAEAEIATRISTATRRGAAARGTAARVPEGQPTPPPPRAPHVPPAPAGSSPHTNARGPAPEAPGSRVELPYMAAAPGPSPRMPGPGLQLYAGEVTTEAAPSDKATVTTPGVAHRRPKAPVKLSPSARRAPHPEPQPPPRAPRRPVEDDFWADSTVVVLVDPEAASSELEATAAPKPDTALLATENTEAVGWSDLAVLDERTELAHETRYDARAHPLGVWMSQVDDTLRRRWVYPPALRALGVGGTVVVRFHVSRAGVISSLEVESGSGNEQLDQAALAAFPAKVAAMPVGSGAGVWSKMEFRYRGSAP